MAFIVILDESPTAKEENDGKCHIVHKALCLLDAGCHEVVHQEEARKLTELEFMCKLKMAIKRKSLMDGSRNDKGGSPSKSFMICKDPLSPLSDDSPLTSPLSAEPPISSDIISPISAEKERSKPLRLQSTTKSSLRVVPTIEESEDYRRKVPTIEESEDYRRKGTVLAPLNVSSPMKRNDPLVSKKLPSISSVTSPRMNKGAGTPTANKTRSRISVMNDADNGPSNLYGPLVEQYGSLSSSQLNVLSLNDDR